MLLVTNIGSFPYKYLLDKWLVKNIYVKDYKFQCETKKIHENHGILIF